MFGDPENNPHGYSVVKMKDVAVGSLSYGAIASAVPYDGVTRFIRITDINDDGSLNNDVKSASKVDMKYKLNDGDILFARTGATVGKTYRYRQEHGSAIYAGFLIRLIPDRSKILPDFLFAFTKSAYYEKFVADTQRVVAQPNINAQEYGDLKLILPSLDKQTEFSNLVIQVDKSKHCDKDDLKRDCVRVEHLQRRLHDLHDYASKLHDLIFIIQNVLVLEMQNGLIFRSVFVLDVIINHC